jgi:hypothetical protein
VKWSRLQKEPRNSSSPRGVEKPSISLRLLMPPVLGVGAPKGTEVDNVIAVMTLVLARSSAPTCAMTEWLRRKVVTRRPSAIRCFHYGLWRVQCGKWNGGGETPPRRACELGINPP